MQLTFTSHFIFQESVSGNIEFGQTNVLTGTFIQSGTGPSKHGLLMRGYLITEIQ